MLNDFLLVEHLADGTLNPAGSLASKYEMPEGGIAASDLALVTQTSLGRADAALPAASLPAAIDAHLQDPQTGAPLSTTQVAWIKANVSDASAQVGLRDPNPGVARFRSLPRLMTTPPAISASVRNTLNITNGVHVNWNDSRFRQFGPALMQSPSETQMGRPTSRVSGYWRDFMHDGSSFSVAIRGAGDAAACKIMVDGEWATDGYEGGIAGGIGTDGGHYYLKYDFGTRAIRHIRILFAGVGGNDAADWRGILIGPTDSLWTPTTPVGPCYVFFGDSWTFGTAAGYRGFGYGFVAGLLLGTYNVVVSGLPGTGYSKTSNGGASPKFGDRIAADALAYNPALLCMFGSINDSGIAAATITADANALYAAVAAARPNTRLVVFGPQNPSGAVDATVIATRNAVRDAAMGNPNVDLFVDSIGAASAGTSSLGWFTGTGKTTALANNGNADIYTNGADNHPTRPGHAFIGSRVAGAIAGAISAGVLA